MGRSSIFDLDRLSCSMGEWAVPRDLRTHSGGLTFTARAIRPLTDLFFECHYKPVEGCGRLLRHLPNLRRLNITTRAAGID